jgi:predicted site-specific integrase-resolvase
MDGDKLETAEEIAKFLGTNSECVRRWTRLGLIPSVKITAKTIRYSRAAVLAALQAEPAEAVS